MDECILDQNFSGSGKYFQKKIWEVADVIMRDRPCLESSAVSSNCQTLLFLQHKLLESFWKWWIPEKRLKTTGPAPRIHSVMLSVRTVFRGLQLQRILRINKHYSCSSLLFLQNPVPGKSSPHTFSRIFCNYRHKIEWYSNSKCKKLEKNGNFAHCWKKKHKW